MAATRNRSQQAPSRAVPAADPQPAAVASTTPAEAPAVLVSAALVPESPGFVCRWGPMDYDDGVSLDPGQLFEIREHCNNERLLRLGYIEAFTGGETYQCSECGALFTSIQLRSEHGDRRHRIRYEFDPDQEDDSVERALNLANARSPLYLDKTLASLNG